MDQGGFCSQAGALNPYSPWPREAPTVPADITLRSLPERGGAKDRGPVIQGFPGAAVPGAPQTLTGPPGLRLSTPCGVFPSRKLKTPGSASPAHRL